MIASSATVLANLAYLIAAVVLAALGGLVVWWRHRKPRSVDARMDSFRRGLEALAPDAPRLATPRPVAPGPPRASESLTHVRLSNGAAAESSGRSAEPGDAANDGGQAG